MLSVVDRLLPQERDGAAAALVSRVSAAEAPGTGRPQQDGPVVHSLREDTSEKHHTVS